MCKQLEGIGIEAVFVMYNDVVRGTDSALKAIVRLRHDESQSLSSSY